MRNGTFMGFDQAKWRFFHIFFPLVNIYITMKDPPFFMRNFTILMVIFHSYVTNYQRVTMRNGTFMGFHEAKWRFFMTGLAWFVMDRKGYEWDKTSKNGVLSHSYPFLAMEMIFQLTCFALAIISMMSMASWKIHDLLRGFSRRTKQQRGQFLGF